VLGRGISATIYPAIKGCIIFAISAHMGRASKSQTLIAGSITAMLFVTRTDMTVPECEVECMGLCPRDSETEEILRWGKKRVEVGDEISFKVVQVESAQEPFASQVIPKNKRQPDRLE